MFAIRPGPKTQVVYKLDVTVTRTALQSDLNITHRHDEHAIVTKNEYSSKAPTGTHMTGTERPSLLWTWQGRTASACRLPHYCIKQHGERMRKTKRDAKMRLLHRLCLWMKMLW